MSQTSLWSSGQVVKWLGKTHSRVTIFFISLFCLFLLTAGLGCKAPSKEAAAAAQPVTLNYWTVYNDKDQLQAFADAYKLVRPYVTVNIRQLRADEFDRVFVTALADDVGPDVVSVHVNDLYRHVSRLASMPSSVKVARITVKGKYAKETVVELEQNSMPSIGSIERDYVTAVGDDVIVDGKAYGLPLSFDTLALYYNQDLLDKAGVAEPPTSWDEFASAVKRATVYDKDGNILQAGASFGSGKTIDHVFDIVSALMLQKNVTIAQNRAVTFANGIDRGSENHPTLEALRFYTDFSDPTKETYAWNDKVGDGFDAFVRGKSAMYFGFAFDRSRIAARAPQRKIASVALPQLNPTRPGNVASYSIESVTKRSKHQNEAWDFVRFMSAPDNVKKYTEATGQPSPLRAHLKEALAAENPSPFAVQAISAVHWYHGTDFVAAKTAFVDMVGKLLEAPPSGESRARRDGAVVERAAQIIQQTY